MPRTPLLAIALATLLATVASAQTRLVPAPPAGAFWLWPDLTPPDCPFEKSAQLTDLGFTGRHAEYTHADTWYPSWGADGRLYSCFTDGTAGSVSSWSGNADAVVGHAIIVGDDPLHLNVIEPGLIPGPARPYPSRYPSANLYFKGVWYIGTYCLAPAGRVPHDGVTYNWPWLGPFVGFHHSRDKGKTWTACPLSPAAPLFGEHCLEGEPVRVGAPHVVDFGQEMQHSPDGKVYLVAHGASQGPQGRRFGYNSWITGDEICLLRVTPDIASINDVSQYEFFAGHNAADQPVWSSDMAAMKPIARWPDQMGCATMTYNAPLNRYLMCVTDGTNTTGYFNSYVLEANRITGPWRLVKYLHHFGEQAYFLNIPSKYISDDGRTIWLYYSANFAAGWNDMPIRSNPPGSQYRMCLQEIRLLDRDKNGAVTPLGDKANIAPYATLTVSSTHSDYSACGAVDRVVDGFPGDIAREWASLGEKETSMIRLNWPGQHTIERVWLFDRPNDLDQVTTGMLVFSDGSTIITGALPDDAKQGLEVRFPPKRIDWLAFIVTSVKPASPNIGLSEIAVFETSSDATR